jgi:hypothetical protein
MKRKSHFKKATPKPKIIKDSRFGVRKLYFNDMEKPSVAVYMNPGRGASGEHQS